ncbi:MAG: 2-oxoglutarate dehydrogenase complex dihydrolipoyllysine-residue succinyltransferase [Chitinophagaceae bacterium]|nr:MAG: 2-oxoglutarate dehydrogenase complex dihydrolipoyllysine-residue succinyltransferase [Chitinophagaceae bacterium]
MEIEIKIPPVGESITEVTIATWVKKDGEHVEADEIICEIESDKATFELNAEAAGTLKVLVQEGETIAIGDKIASINTDGAGASGDAKPANHAKPTPVEETSTSKVTASANAPQQEERGDNAVGNESKEDKGKEASYVSNHPSPAAQKILSEKGIEAQNVQGSGKDGRITKEDAVKAENKPQQASAPAAQTSAPKPQASTQATFTGERNTHSEKMSSLRKTIAKRLVEVKNNTAMLTTFNEVDLSAVMDMRKKYKDIFKEKHQVGLGFMSLFTKAVCEGLKEFPAVNAQIQDTDIIYHDYVDIGIAVSTPKGLVVPNIRNAEKMSLAQIEKEIGALAAKARDGKITIEDMTGGTFTITNGGVFGSLMSTPIINAPQAAILGMHNIVERPVAVNGQVVIRPMMYIALSYDHRIIDGRESVSFLVRVKQMLEDPYRMVLEV